MPQDFLRHDQDAQLRLRHAAIDWLRERSHEGEIPLSREDILDFRFEGEPFRLQDVTKGIRRPAGFAAALTVTTSFKPKKQFEIYDDHLGADGLWNYSWEKGGSNVPTNVGLLTAYQQRVPSLDFWASAGSRQCSGWSPPFKCWSGCLRGSKLSSHQVLSDGHCWKTANISWTPNWYFGSTSFARRRSAFINRTFARSF